MQINTIALNVGYHNEYHDIPSVPWKRLPRVKAMAPELYEGLVSRRSLGKLPWRFLSEAGITLFSRMVRKNRGGIPRPTRPDHAVITSHSLEDQ